MLDDITLYWLTNTATSSARLYWENKDKGINAADISIPVGVTVFPGEMYHAPRSWAERTYHKLIYWNEVDKGGHFAVWEQPELFAGAVDRGTAMSDGVQTGPVRCLSKSGSAITRRC